MLDAYIKPYGLGAAHLCWLWTWKESGLSLIQRSIHLIQPCLCLSVSHSLQAMMRPCYSAILNHAAGGKPAIVFVPTRKHVRLTALDLLTSAAADGDQHR